MILQALVECYEDLSAQGKIPTPGWSLQKISYILCIDADGQLEEAICVRQPEQRGKKEVWVPKLLELPAGVKKASGIISNFLWENSSYILGVDNKGKPERAKDCFEACRELHKKVLSDVKSGAAVALCSFFEKWNPEMAEAHPALRDVLEDIKSGVNLSFRYNGVNIQENSEIRNAWRVYSNSDEAAIPITCLVTGKTDKLAVLHPSIKGIPGAQSSGASLVSYNAPAFCSFNREQGANAQTGEYAAFAYGAALNYLISDREHTFRIGDTTVLCWAQGAQTAYQSLFECCLMNADTGYSQEDIAAIIKGMLQGQVKEYDDTLIDPERPFYILGISPNAARLSVRFFLKDSFGSFIRNVSEHQNRLRIISPLFEKYETAPLWQLLSETVNQNSRDKTASPQLAGDMLRAILNNTRYPATLLNAVTLRIRADHKINRNRAAIIKAYYLKNQHPEVPEKEVLTMALKSDSTSVPYQLGRLFAILEGIQSTANPGINATIKDKYFNSASATPAVVFPQLVNLAQKHLRKIGGGLKVTLSRQLEEVMSHLPEEYPARLSLPQQGAFQIGYYHQTQERFVSK